MSNQGPKVYNAEGAVGRHRIVKHGTAAGTVKVGAAATDKFIGVSTEVDVADTGRCDVNKTGLCDVILGGSVTKGDFITSDANGAAVTAATGNRFVGIAEESGVTGDQIQMTISHGKMP